MVNATEGFLATDDTDEHGLDACGVRGHGFRRIERMHTDWTPAAFGETDANGSDHNKS